MATTTAAITLTSADLLTDALSLSATNTLYKAGSTVGLDQTTGMARVHLTATTVVDIFPQLIEASIALKINLHGFIFVTNQRMKLNLLQ